MPDSNSSPSESSLVSGSTSSSDSFGLEIPIRPRITATYTGNLPGRALAEYVMLPNPRNIHGYADPSQLLHSYDATDLTRAGNNLKIKSSAMGGWQATQAPSLYKSRIHHYPSTVESTGHSQPLNNNRGSKIYTLPNATYSSHHKAPMHYDFTQTAGGMHPAVRMDSSDRLRPSRLMYSHNIIEADRATFRSYGESLLQSTEPPRSAAYSYTAYEDIPSTYPGHYRTPSMSITLKPQNATPLMVVNSQATTSLGLQSPQRTLSFSAYHGSIGSSYIPPPLEDFSEWAIPCIDNDAPRASKPDAYESQTRLEDATLQLLSIETPLVPKTYNDSATTPDRSKYIHSVMGRRSVVRKKIMRCQC